MESEPQTPNPIIVIGALIVLISVIGFFAWLTFPEDRQASVTTPLRALCFRIAQQDIPDHSPAYWIEQNGLENHSHRTRTSLRCTADLNGKLVEFDADQIWVARAGIEQRDKQ